jgi:hypothetical protein
MVFTAPIFLAESDKASSCGITDSFSGIVTDPPPLLASRHLLMTWLGSSESKWVYVCGKPSSRKAAVWIQGDGDSATGLPNM